MISNKVLFLVFGVLALVFTVSLSSEVSEQDSSGISDRRYRWASSEEDSDESGDQDADAEDDDDQDGSGSDEFEEIEIWEEAPDSGESSESDESASHEA